MVINCPHTQGMSGKYYTLHRSDTATRATLNIYACLIRLRLQFLDLPIRWSYKLTDVRSFVRYELFSGLAHLIFLIFCTMMQNGNTQNVTDLDF